MLPSLEFVAWVFCCERLFYILVQLCSCMVFLSSSVLIWLLAIALSFCCELLPNTNGLARRLIVFSYSWSSSHSTARILIPLQIISDPKLDSDTSVIRNAMELAVLTTLSHPNIVQVGGEFTAESGLKPIWGKAFFWEKA